MSWDYKTIKKGSKADRKKLADDGFERYRSDAAGDHYRRRKAQSNATTKAKTKE